MENLTKNENNFVSVNFRGSVKEEINRLCVEKLNTYARLHLLNIDTYGVQMEMIDGIVRRNVKTKVSPFRIYS